MMRITMILLCLMLAAAAAGRYQAEAAVREARQELRRLDREKARELSSIQLLRAEIAYLESPERLAVIAGEMTDLRRLSGAQLMTAEDFEIAFGEGAEPARSGASERASVVTVAALERTAPQ